MGEHLNQILREGIMAALAEAERRQRGRTSGPIPWFTLNSCIQAFGHAFSAGQIQDAVEALINEGILESRVKANDTSSPLTVSIILTRKGDAAPDA